MTNESFTQAAQRIINGSADLVDEWNFTNEWNIRTLPDPYSKTMGESNMGLPVPPVCEKAAEKLKLPPQTDLTKYLPVGV